jgi:hypothetical protein
MKLPVAKASVTSLLSREQERPGGLDIGASPEDKGGLPTGPMTFYQRCLGNSRTAKNPALGSELPQHARNLSLWHHTAHKG